MTYVAMNPDDKTFYEDRSEYGEQLYLREVAELEIAKNFSLEANVYHLANYSSLKNSLTNYVLSATNEDNRSSYLTRHYHNKENSDLYLVCDQLSLSATFDRVSTLVGRFPINLSTMNVFKPNDLFGPSQGISFYTKYKPGVDAAQADVRIGQLSNVQFFAVRGYSGNSSMFDGSNSEKNNTFDYGQSSVLAKGNANIANFALSAIAGRYGHYDLYGGSLQGEIAGKFGVRGEGHYKKYRSEDIASLELSLGFEERFGENILVFSEFFANGKGYDNPEHYNTGLSEDIDPPSTYFGHYYQSLGINYDWTPLTTVRFLGIVNLSDQSFLLVTSIGHSLTEFAEIALSSINPVGKPSKEGELQSEYGTYPNLINLEMNAYF